jgi:hypothetical protein
MRAGRSWFTHLLAVTGVVIWQEVIWRDLLSFHWQSYAFQPIFTIAVRLRRSPTCYFKTSPDIHGPAHAFRVVRGYFDAGMLCARGSQPVVCSWLRRRMRFGIDLRISPGRLALRARGGYLVSRRGTALVG